VKTTVAYRIRLKREPSGAQSQKNWQVLSIVDRPHMHTSRETHTFHKHIQARAYTRTHTHRKKHPHTQTYTYKSGKYRQIKTNIDRHRQTLTNTVKHRKTQTNTDKFSETPLKYTLRGCQNWTGDGGFRERRKVEVVYL
jgi:hypothetical protein